MKIRPVGAELLLADGRADVKKQIFAFRKFARPPENVIMSIILKKFTEHTHAPFGISGTTANSKQNIQKCVENLLLNVNNKINQEHKILNI
jgi:hypothetical protein